MLSNDLIERFWTSVKLERVRYRRSNLVFLCGGKSSKPNEPPASARQLFLTQVLESDAELASRIKLAEELAKGDAWKESGPRFQDLLELEQLMAEIVGAIVLFVESPGSFAELGAFSATDSIRERLIAVIEERHGDDTQSFIFLGPVKRILRFRDSSLLYVHWLTDTGDINDSPAVAKELRMRVTSAVNDLLDENGKTRELANVEQSDGEAMYLLAGLLDLFQLLSKTEITALLRYVAPRTSDSLVSRYLYVLEMLGIVKLFEYSGQKWFHVDEELIEWSFQENSATRSRPAWKREILEYYKQHSDKTLRALKVLLESQPSKDK